MYPGGEGVRLFSVPCRAIKGRYGLIEALNTTTLPKLKVAPESIQNHLFIFLAAFLKVDSSSLTMDRSGSNPDNI
jgi:hypothetical protein